MGDSRDATPGVYLLDEDGSRHLVHEYRDDGYELHDVHDLLALGRVEHGGALLLTPHEMRLLEVTANAQSFDHAPEFISMCLDMCTVSAAPGVTTLRFVCVG